MKTGSAKALELCKPKEKREVTPEMIDDLSARFATETPPKPEEIKYLWDHMVIKSGAVIADRNEQLARSMRGLLKKTAAHMKAQNATIQGLQNRIRKLEGKSAAFTPTTGRSKASIAISRIYRHGQE